ncbi:MAG: Uma2 family endonuclease [Chitinophagales bacterium]
MADPALKQYGLLEYLEMEEYSEEKHEYHDGFIKAMSGGTLDHSTITSNVVACIREESLKQGGKCRPANGDLKVYIEGVNKSFYPDAMAICEEAEFHLGRKDIITNPTLIVEVLSKGTEAFDRGKKFRCYQKLPSFKEYILVSQDQPVVEGYFREDESLWRISNAVGLDKSIPFYSMGCEVQLKDIYAFINFSGDAQLKLDL